LLASTNFQQKTYFELSMTRKSECFGWIFFFGFGCNCWTPDCSVLLRRASLDRLGRSFKLRISDLSEADRKSMENLVKTLQAAHRGCEHYAGAYVEDQGSNAIHLLQDLNMVHDIPVKSAQSSSRSTDFFWRTYPRPDWDSRHSR
jgi:hypothetical protein